MRGGRESDKREFGSGAMRKMDKSVLHLLFCSGLGDRERAGSADHEDKKRGSIRRWSPMKVVANGRGRRKRRLPLDRNRGRRFGSNPVSGNTGPREEDAVRCLSDRLNMWVERDSSNVGADMSAMRLMQGRSACLTQLKTFWEAFSGAISNNKALLEGRAGPKFERGRASRKRDASQARRESARRRPGFYRSPDLIASIRDAACQPCETRITVRMLSNWRRLEPAFPLEEE